MRTTPPSSKRLRLSENFYLDEFTRSETAARFGIEITVKKGSDIWLSLERLCRTVLQPLRDEVGPVTILSGYRPDTVNSLVGGSPTSQHRFGQAADIVVADMTPLEVCQAISWFSLPFDELIHEYGHWCHVSVTSSARVPRGQMMTAYKAGPDRPTLYPSGLHTMSALRKRYG